MQSQVLQWVDDVWVGDNLDAEIVFAFLDPVVARETSAFAKLKSQFPGSIVVGCTTGGEIAKRQAYTGAAFAAVMKFDGTHVKAFEAEVFDANQSRDIARDLASQMPRDDLSCVYIISDGTRVNGSMLVAGFRDVLGANVSLNGGLAGDGADFGETLVGCHGDLAAGRIVAIGFYGSGVKIRTGSFGGWEPYGPKRKITKADGNVLFQLDGKSALDLYKKYLGADADALPSSALFYPLQITAPSGGESVVRTILNIDETTGAMIFAGDMPEGWLAQFMAGERRNLIEGAEKAAKEARGCANGGFALLVSCIGRRLVLGQRATEEVSAAVEALGNIEHAGFYSYGEISPNGQQGTCNLHNQTMTITVFEPT